MQSLTTIKEDNVGFVITFKCEEKFYKKNFEGVEEMDKDILSREEPIPEENSDKYQEIFKLMKETQNKSQTYITHLRRVFDLVIFN